MKMFKWKDDDLIRDIYATFVLYHGSIIIGLDIAFTSYFVENREDFNILQEGLVGSISIFSRAVGSIGSIFIVDYLGRKMTMFLGFAVSSFGWLAIFLASSPDNLLIGRVICGLSIALMYSTHVIYISEVCNKNRRGALLAARMISVSIGMNMVTLIAYYYHWRWVALLGVLVCVSGSILLKYIPETKYWLISHDRYDEAVESAMWFSRTESMIEIEAALKRIEYSCYERKKNEDGICTTLFHRRSSLKALVCSILLVIFTVGCGRTATITHIEHFFISFQNNFDSKKLVIYLNVAELFVCLLYVIIADRYKRRSVLYFTLYLMASSIIGIIIYDLQLDEEGISVPVVPVIFLCVYLMITVNGLWTNVTTFVTELAPNENRASVMNITNCVMSASSGIYSTILPYVLKYFQIRYVLIYFLFNVFCIMALTRFVLPETRGKELHECGFRPKAQKNADNRG